jgi:radical SAM protein with 4Fe4S-binding SPASM domain
MLSLLEVKRIISDFAHMGGKILEISGGEPLMHPDLFEIVAYATMNRLETVLYTSGVALNEYGREFSITAEFAGKLRRLGLEKIIFNMQGAIAETHESITQKEGSFKNLVHGIKVMKLMGCWVGVHFVPMKLNYTELKDVIQMCHKLGVNEIGLLRFVPQGRGLTNKELLELSESEFLKFIQNVVKLKKSSHGNPKIRIGRPINFCPLIEACITKEECDAGITRCLISPKGNVLPCPAFKQYENEDYMAGNVKVSSLADIWRYSPTWTYFRQFDYTKLNEPCESCGHLHWCQGGCKAQRILEYGDMYAAPDPICIAPHFGKKIVIQQVCKV